MGSLAHFKDEGITGFLGPAYGAPQKPDVRRWHPQEPPRGSDRETTRAKAAEALAWPDTRAVLGCWASGLKSILDSRLSQFGGTCRRRLPRQDRIVLTPAERTRARTIAKAVLYCRTGYLTFRRFVPLGGDLREQRLTIEARCCQRWCEGCGQIERERRAVRAQGCWALFETLGLPAGVMSCGTAWRQVSAWVRILMQRVKDEGNRWARWRGSRRAWASRAPEPRVRPGDRSTRPRGWLQYAWAVEPHASGYPHVHFVTNAGFIDDGWLREQWGLVVGTTCRWSKRRSVYSPDGVCRYLTKYISKSRLTLDICAIMYRKRLGQSTTEKALPADPDWSIVKDSKPEERLRELAEGPEGEPYQEWKLEQGKEGRYAIWSRPAAWSEVAEWLPDLNATSAEIDWTLERGPWSAAMVALAIKMRDGP